MARQSKKYPHVKLINDFLDSISVSAVTEYKFHPTRRWKFDLAIPSQMVAIEYEGGNHWTGQSRHSRGSGFVNDVEKYTTAASLGWRVFRFTAKDVKPSQKWLSDWCKEMLESIKKESSN